MLLLFSIRARNRPYYVLAFTVSHQELFHIRAQPRLNEQQPYHWTKKLILNNISLIS